ncbi:MAG: hypothetical protein P1U37_12155 [Minwuia sp.]|nr:hypothetical protein [Minwuia sp.]
MRTFALVLGIVFGLVNGMADAEAAREASSTSTSGSGTGTGDRDTDFAASDQFNKALNAWLDNDDAIAIPMLSRLATEGHVPAQIFLGRIATRTASEYVEQLSRDARKSLLRAPGGLSGTSWLTVAANSGSSLAEAFNASQRPPYSVSKVRKLLEHGEVAEATAFLLRSVDSGAMEQIDDLLKHDGLPKYSHYPIGLSIVHHRELTAETIIKFQQILIESGPARILLAAAFESRYGGDLTSNLRNFAERLSGNGHSLLEPTEKATLSALDSAAFPLGSLRPYCKSHCPVNVSACLYDALPLVGGYNELWKLMSPVESYVTTTRYHQSKRAIADVARYMRSKSFSWGSRYKRQIKAQSCAATALTVD